MTSSRVLKDFVFEFLTQDTRSVEKSADKADALIQLSVHFLRSKV